MAEDFSALYAVYVVDCRKSQSHITVRSEIITIAPSV